MIVNDTKWMVAAVVGMALAGCSRGPARYVPPGVNANAGTEAVEKYDADGNGKLSNEELSASPALKSAISLMDKDGDVQLTPSEIDARIDEWRESKVALTSVMVTVRFDGRPLSGAEVAFVPQLFMGN